MEREKFSSRLGFILTAAGCAIGLGNIYRFPYITGEYGGAIFVLIYLICILIMGLPLIVMELAVGRGSRRSSALALQELRPDIKGWKVVQIPQVLGNYVFQMFYTTIIAQMLYFAYAMIFGKLNGLTVQQIQSVSDSLAQDPWILGGIMVIVVLMGFIVCYSGLQKGVEKVSKIMLVILFMIMIFLAIYSLTLPGSKEGIDFYLKPNFTNVKKAGLYKIVSAAFGQVFFSLGIGAGSMCIFGSYCGKESSLTGQAIQIIALDTGVALTAGLIVFPACFTYGINPANGPDLIMITMPAVFNKMFAGQFIGSMFFVAVLMAALSTVIAAFENIVACTMDLFRWNRKKATLANILPMIILSMPAVLGMSVWGNFNIFSRGIIELEDFLVSNNLLPFGAMGYLFFCISRYGWGWNNFITEANAGKGAWFPRWMKKYCIYLLPIIMIVFLLIGYIG
ncbi:MAG TPA: sodium-dependent transporter [Clostridiales bacterium]|nr:sodium-dependent transporter [Clostridiales bacterium]